MATNRAVVCHLTSQYHEEEHHDECIAKVEEVRQATSNGGLVHKVVNRE